MDRKAIYYGCLFLSLFAPIMALAEPIFGGENVCNKTITVRRDKTVDVPVQYELRYSAMCFLVPCTKTRTETRMDSQLKTTYEQMNVALCCPGYAETPERECVPICIKPCNHGSCAAPGQCKCHPEPTETSPGFVGSSCNRFTCLASNRWGTDCKRECNCPQNSYCSASTGKCICRSGWRGVNCTEECDSTMNCDEVELPPVIEPDANIISEKMEALAPKALLKDYDTSEESATGGYNISGLNVCLFAICFLLGFVLSAVMYLHKKKDSIYYSSSSGSSSPSGSSSYYSASTLGHNIQDRPMPAPPSANLYNKNLNFDSATRYILLKGDNPSSQAHLNDIKVDSRLEAHLIASQMSSKQNLYSDIEKGSGDKSLNQTSVVTTMNRANEIHKLQVSISAPEDSASSHYQVPKSPSIRAQATPLHIETSSNQSTGAVQQIYGVYANDDEQNLYEEIKPRPPQN